MVERFPAFWRALAGSSRTAETRATSPTWACARRRERRLLSLVREHKLRRMLRSDARRGRVPRAVRRPLALALPRRAPVRFGAGGHEHRVEYEPAESHDGAVRRQLELARAGVVPGQLPGHRVAAAAPPLLRRRFKVECPTGSGAMDDALRGRRRAVAAAHRALPRAHRRAPARLRRERAVQHDPHLRDLVMFYEYFHGDNGAGLGASHQTGWTALVARLIQSLGQFTASSVLEGERWPLTQCYHRFAASTSATSKARTVTAARDS